MVIIIGDSCRDENIYGKVRRICPEAPVPVFDKIRFTDGGGGMAANVATNFCALGIKYKLYTNHKCETKTRYFDEISGQMVLRVDSLPDKFHEQERFADVVDEVDFSKASAVVIADYDKHYFYKKDLAAIHKRYNGPIFIDTKKPLGKWLKDVTCIKINEKEWLESGSPELDNICVTLGRNGACWQTKLRIPPPVQVRARDVCGAGDTFLAGLVAYYLKHDGDMPRAIEFAIRCASAVVEMKGVCPVPEKMREYL